MRPTDQTPHMSLFLTGSLLFLFDSFFVFSVHVRKSWWCSHRLEKNGWRILLSDCTRTYFQQLTSREEQMRFDSFWISSVTLLTSSYDDHLNWKSLSSGIWHPFIGLSSPIFRNAFCFHLKGRPRNLSWDEGSSRLSPKNYPEDGCSWRLRTFVAIYRTPCRKRPEYSPVLLWEH
jgi:hypothetical protein